MTAALPQTLPVPQIRRYQHWLREQRGLGFESYDALWRWSVTDLAGFWQSIWDYFELESPTPHSAVLAEERMPGARWFPGAQLNYARQVLRHVDAAAAAGMPAIVSSNERGERREMSWPDLQRQVGVLAQHLLAQGVRPGDRVAAYLPNVPETMVAFLAAASIGAVWSVCAPDMGTNAVLDRFRQIEPKVLIACDGVRYGGRDIDRREVVAQLRAELPTVSHVLLLSDAGRALPGTAALRAVLSRQDAAGDFEPLWLPFDHPLWIVYSSGTTGLPKPIVHGHGGILLVHLLQLRLHNDIGCSWEADTFGERFHWYSSTGWVMWNLQASGLANGTTCCLYDGNPAGSKDQPDWGVLWRFAAETGVTFFGAGAAFYASCMKAGVDLAAMPQLRHVRTLGVTGSPLSEDVQRWGTQSFAKLGRASAAGPPQGARAPSGGSDPHAVGERGGDIWWANISGGTDFASAFIGGNRELPQVPGELQCRQLGCAVEAWDEQGKPVVDQVGELVCTRPLPSMPLYFWNDPGNARYIGSYFDMYPGVWRHGDWLRITARGTCVVYGRSDATINRHGLRLGTSEIYAAVEAVPEVLDSLVVDLEYLGRPSFMPLFVVLRPGAVLDDALRERIAAAVRSAVSPRFVPDAIVQMAEVPRTLSGKKQELPIKKLLLGQPLDKVVNREAMANPACLDAYLAYAASRAGV